MTNKLPFRKILIILAILLLATFLRFWHISSNPPGLYWDEVANGYNAYSILKTAKDEYGTFMPLTFRAFDDWRPALAIYPLVPSIAVFGLNEFGVRFPAALLGVLTVFLTYLLVKKFFENENISLLSAFFLAISPWHIQFTRAQFEAGFMLFFCLLSLYIFHAKKLSTATVTLSALILGLALNSYQGAKVWVPLFAIINIVFNIKNVLKLKQRLIFPIIVLAIFCLPFVLDFKNTLARGRTVSVFYNSKTPYLDFVKGYLSHYSGNFLFIYGTKLFF